MKVSPFLFGNKRRVSHLSGSVSVMLERTRSFIIFKRPNAQKNEGALNAPPRTESLFEPGRRMASPLLLLESDAWHRPYFCYKAMHGIAPTLKTKRFRRFPYHPCRLVRQSG